MLDENLLGLVVIGSGIASAVGLLAVGLGKVGAVALTAQRSVAMAGSSVKPVEQPGGAWYDRDGWLALALIVFWPLGYFGLLKTSRISALAKGLAVTVLGLSVVYVVLRRDIQSLEAQIDALQSHAEASSSTAKKAASDAKEANRKFDEIFRKSMRE